MRRAEHPRPRVTTGPARYPRAVRRLTVVAVLVLGLAACGGSGGSKPKPVQVTVGVGGGVKTPYGVRIVPGGAVATNGTPPAQVYPLTREQDEKLSDRVRTVFPQLKSKHCSGTTKYDPVRFITALGTTVSVRGGCDTRFTNLWDFLTNSVGIFQVGGF